MRVGDLRIKKFNFFTRLFYWGRHNYTYFGKTIYCKSAKDVLAFRIIAHDIDVCSNRSVLSLVEGNLGSKYTLEQLYWFLRECFNISEYRGIYRLNRLFYTLFFRYENRKFENLANAFARRWVKRDFLILNGELNYRFYYFDNDF